jgi:hypothetical protein
MSVYSMRKGIEFAKSSTFMFLSGKYFRIAEAFNNDIVYKS